MRPVDTFGRFQVHAISGGLLLTQRTPKNIYRAEEAMMCCRSIAQVDLFTSRGRGNDAVTQI